MVSHTSGAAIASAIAPADARLEDAWDDIEQQVNRHPRGDDEVPVDRVFEDVDEPFAVERTVKREPEQHQAVGEVCDQMAGVKSQRHPYDRTVRIRVPP